MKLKLLFLSIIGSITLANAQYTVTDVDGNVLNDGDIVEYGTIAYPDASFDFFVTNNSSEEIYSRVQLVDSENATNSTFEQLCYGTQCYYQIEMNQYVPPMGVDAVIIPSGHTTGIGNHFYNNDPGNGTDNVDYTFTFKFFEDAQSTVEVGTPLTFIYRYNPTLGVEATNKVGLSIPSTVVSGQLALIVNEPIDVKMFDIQGRLVNQAHFEAGNQYLNVSNLSAQTYILQVRNAAGSVKTTKIVVR